MWSRFEPVIIFCFSSIPLANAESKGDSGATYASGFYNVGNGTLLPPRKYAVRVRLQEDRVMHVKQKFFCDKTTEKTVHLQVSFELYALFVLCPI